MAKFLQHIIIYKLLKISRGRLMTFLTQLSTLVVMCLSRMRKNWP